MERPVDDDRRESGLHSLHGEQHIEDCEKQFAHASGCESELEDVKPWVTLHDLLDKAKG
jgi:hypothetical protein